MKAPKVCAKCKTAPPATGHRWCNACKATYQADYRKTVDSMNRAQGFAAGVEAMRKTLAMEFRRLGIAQVLCFEVASVIERAPAPQCPLRDS